MKPNAPRFLFPITLTCLVSGALSAIAFVGLGDGGGLFFPAMVVMGGGSLPWLMVLLYLLLHLSPGLFFGLVISGSATLRARSMAGPSPAFRAVASVVAFTLVAIGVWLAAYWIVVVPFQSGLRNLVLPATVAALVGSFLLSVASRGLPNLPSGAVGRTTLLGAAAGLVFFLHPAAQLELGGSEPALPVLAWTIGFALWQGVVGWSLFFGPLRVAARAVSGASETEPLPAQPPVPLQAPPDLGQARLLRPRQRGVLRAVAAPALLAVVLLAAAALGGFTRSSRQPLLTLGAQSQLVTSVAFSPDGTRLATAGDSGSAIIWDAATGQRLLDLSGHSAYVHTIIFSADGKRLATASQDQSVILWDAASGQAIHLLTGRAEVPNADLFRNPGGKRGVAFSPDGTFLAAASNEGSVQIWDTATGGLVRTFFNDEGQFRAIVYSPDGTRLATASHFGTASVWDAARGRELLRVDAQTYNCLGVAFSPDGARLATTNGTVAVVWDAATGEKLLTLADSFQQSGEITNIVYSPDGARLATADGSAKVWDAATGQLLFTLSDGADSILTVAFSADGRRLATGGADKAATLWDIEP